MFNFVRNCQIVLQSFYTILHPQQQWVCIPATSLLVSTWRGQYFIWVLVILSKHVSVLLKFLF